MPKLEENNPAFGMHRVGHLAPSRDLFRAVDARRPGIALAARLDLRTFGHHEPGAGALTVIGGHEVVGDISRLRAARTRERREDDPIAQGVRT